MSFQHFRLHPIAPQPQPDGLNPHTNSMSPSSLSHALVQPDHSVQPNFQLPQLPQTPNGASGSKKGPYGSGDADDGYTLVFESMEAFQAWRQKEEEEKMVEFVKGDTHGSKAVPPRFKDHTKLVCARHSRSGRKKYVKKYPDRVRKVPSRKLDGVGCPASISYKTYFDNDEVRACYVPDHSHEIGPANFPFTKRGRKAQAEQQQARARARNRAAGNESNSSSSPPRSAINLSPTMGNAVAGPSSASAQIPQMHPRSGAPPPVVGRPQTFQSAISMIAPLPQPPPPPPAEMSQDRWDRMSVLFNSIRDHARGFEYPGASVAALESVLIRLYLESPMAGGMAPQVGGMGGMNGVGMDTNGPVT